MQLERNGNNKLLEYAYKLLSKKEYSSYSLKEKLVLKGASEIEANEIVNHLIEKGYLNDDKLLSDIISRDNTKLYGKYKILIQLKKYHLVTSDLNDRFPEEIELEKAKQLVDELEDKYVDLSYQKKVKQIHTYLARYGYETYIISLACEFIKPIDENSEHINLIKDLQKAILRNENIKDNYLLKQKVIKALMAKGYRYNDILIEWEALHNEIN